MKDCSIDEIRAIANAGYDTTEVFVDRLMNMGDEEFAALKAMLAETGLKIQITSSPYPNATVIHSDDFDLAGYEETLRKRLARCAEVGAKYIVFGQRSSRMLPSATEAICIDKRKKVLESMKMCAKIAREVGMEMLIETCGTNEANYCTYFADAVGWIEEIGVPGVGIMCSTFHLMNRGEPYENMVRYKHYIKHIHIRNPYEPAPPSLTDGFDYGPFMNALKEMEYDGPIVFNCRKYDNFAEDIKGVKEFFAHYGYKPARG